MKTKDHNKRTFARRAAMTLLAAVMTTMAWAQNPATIGSIRYNTALGAYEINSVENLNDLAVYVSGRGQYTNSSDEFTYSDGTLADGVHDCTNMTFKMTADITFTHLAAGAEGADTEDNFTPIGIINKKSFCGHFDGFDPTDNISHTISGIRINSDILTSRIGLFGCLGSGARVEGVTLADAAISGESSVGGIAGDNRGGTVTYCTVRKSVSIYGHLNLGGIVGNNTKDTNDNLGIITGSTSCKYTGGIVGYNIFGSLTDNLAIEATVHGSSYYYHGAIVGFISKSNYGEIARNYYRHCTVDGVVNATGKGIYNNDTDGALPLHSLTVPIGVTATTNTQPIRIADEDNDLYPSGTVFTLSGGLDDLDNPDDDGYMKGYTTTAGTLVGSTTSGFTLILRGGDATVGTTSRFLIDWAVESTGDDADHAYLIYNAEQLDLVARRVNDVDTRSTYSGKYYRLMNDINYSTDNTDNNYTPIGMYFSNAFQGHFDGGSHTVSGIRINKPGNSCLGLFGCLGEGSTVSHVIVKDAIITGYSYVGCIAGYAGNNTLTANYYYYCSCTVSGFYNTGIGIGCNGADITDNDGAVPVFFIRRNNIAITFQPDPIFTVGTLRYYKPGTVITLDGQPDNTPVEEYYNYSMDNQVINGNTFTMPTYNVSVNFADSPTSLSCVNLASGITATPSPLKSDGSYLYYMPGTTITLSGGLPEAQEGFFCLYTVNGSVIEGNSFTVSSDNIEVGVSPLLPDAPNIFCHSGEWNNRNNWRGGLVPDAGSDVVICANATVPSDYVADAGNVTVMEDYGSITVMDGGQFRLTNDGVTVRMEKIINGCGETNGDYYLIASPMTVSLEPKQVQGLTDGDYHLYYFKEDEETDCWQTPEILENGKGYRYANSQGVQLTFTGHVRPTTAPVSVPLDYTAGKPYAGWNLVGNPFPCAAYVDWEGEVYKMNANGDDFEEVTSRIIDPMEGVLVKATAEGQQVTFIPLPPNLLVLYDNQDNSAAINEAYRNICNVLLSGHTLYKDGRWNPLCLPFDVELEGSPLEGATVMKLDCDGYYTAYCEGDVSLYFNAVSRMEAGIPYLVRWEESEGTETEMTSPLFRSTFFYYSAGISHHQIILGLGSE